MVDQKGIIFIGEDDSEPVCFPGKFSEWICNHKDETKLKESTGYVKNGISLFVCK